MPSFLRQEYNVWQSDLRTVSGLFESPSMWNAAAVARIAVNEANYIKSVTAEDIKPIILSHDLWDMWPVCYASGETALVAGGALWMILSAPIMGDPETRHAHAKIRLFLHLNGTWRDLGLLFPAGFSGGSREWSGSAVYDPLLEQVTLYYTAAGRFGEQKLSFEQRLFETRGKLSVDGGSVSFSEWTKPVESIASDGNHYVIANQTEGVPGTIKAFRDPAFFRDPADGCDYLIFTTSLARSTSAFNGAIGIARKTGYTESWQLLPPLISADRLNNELERPHLIVKDGLYYIFWSTQRHVFAPDDPIGPTGLYGMVAPALFGPYQPLNGTGLVAANPMQQPVQTYSWWVCADLNVYSFIDYWGSESTGIPRDAVIRRRHFGGVPAPIFILDIDGSAVKIIQN